MMSEETPETRRKQLEDLLSTLGSAVNPEKELLNIVIATTSLKDPELGKLITYCAIPRYFDPEIVGILRQTPNEREANDAFFTKLAQLSFTRVRSDARCSFADSAREILLEQWRDSAKRELFDELNQRLAAYHQQNYEKVEQLDLDLDLTASTVRRANPMRLSQLTTYIERRLIEPLLEALYHKHLHSAQAAYTFAESAFFKQEQQRRLTIAETLRNVTLGYVKESSPGDERTALLRWLSYWEGRLANQFRQYQQAEAIVRELLPQTEQDVKLRLWTLGELGTSLSRQEKNRDARDIYQQQIAEAEKTGIDPYNLSTWYLCLADLHWNLDELELAAEKYRKAIDAATGQNIGSEVSARVQLTGVLHGMGERAEALNLIIEAHHLARTKLGSDRGTYRAVIYQLQSLLARRDPRLLDTLYAEIEESTAADARDDSVSLQARKEYFRLLRQGGQLTRNDQLLEKIWPELWASADGDAKNTLLLEKALVREEQGRFENVIELYDELIRLSEGVPHLAYYHAAALSNRGMVRSKVGRWEEAESDLRAALLEWEQGSNEKISGLIKVAMARAQRLQGKLDQAQETLHETRDFFKGGDSSYKADYLNEQGELFAARGRRDEARKNYLEALELNRSGDQYKSAASLLGTLAELAAEEGNWSEAEQYSGESRGFWKKLVDLDSYRPTESALIADAENAAGVQAFFVIDDQRAERILQAQRSFTRASELVPTNFWYQLNLSYACAELEEWDAAAAAIHKVLDTSPKWLHAPKLYERLKDYRLEQGQKLFEKGRFEEAANVYSECLIKQKGKLDDDSIRELELRLGDSRLKLGEFAKAEHSYRNGLESLQRSDSRTFETIFSARLGFARALQLDLAGALQHFKTSINRHDTSQSTNPVDGITLTLGRFSELLTTIEQFRVIGEALRLLESVVYPAADQASALIQARLTLSLSKYQVVRRSTKESARVAATADLPVSTPVILQADAQLFPETDDAEIIERLINKDLPLMREQILKATGVNIPGVRVRADETLSEGQYQLSLFEIPLEGGVVLAGKKFCPDAEACLKLELNGEIAPNPTGTGEGMWLSDSEGEKAALNGLTTLYDPHQFMVAHLESLIQRHLASFVGVQEVQNMIDQWKAEANGERESLAAAALPDNGAMVRLVQVFRRLAEENVPVRNLSTLLASFADANPRSPELNQVAEATRFALRADFTDKPRAGFLQLPHELEEQVAHLVWRVDSKEFVVLTHEEKRKLLASMKELMAAQDTEDFGLVVERHDLRPFVRKLLNEEFPEVPVFAARELGENSPLTASIGTSEKQ